MIKEIVDKSRRLFVELNIGLLITVITSKDLIEFGQLGFLKKEKVVLGIKKKMLV